MAVEEDIQEATCRVDGTSGQGSAFWVAENHLVTAAHVVTASKPDDLTVRSYSGSILEVEVIYENQNTRENPGSDIAILTTTRHPEECQTLPVSSSVPEIGTKVIWSGYARLVGEDPLDRQRFGWGRIASEPYPNGDGTFFEVDGLFNPSHSGGPVVNEETGEVVGIVTQSAGSFEGLYEQWEEKVETLNGLFGLSQAFQGGMFREFSYDDPGNAVHDMGVYDRMGIEYEQEVNDDGNYEISVDPDQIPIRVGQIQAEISELLLDTAQKTFQMGVGIASGGDELINNSP